MIRVIRAASAPASRTRRSVRNAAQKVPLENPAALNHNPSMKRAIIAAILLLVTPSLALAAGANPPPELLQLEREVSLKMAHARDEGFTEPSKLKTLADAQTVDADAEQALKAGEYERAENGFLKTKALLHNLGI
jgi:hypothetical protein